MSRIKTICPHCGKGMSFFSGRIATEMRCARCGGELAFGIDEGRVNIRTGCPHCGNAMLLHDSVLGEELLCLKCGEGVAFHDADDSLRLYHTYAAVLWGVFFPLLGCWLIKRNCRELNMEDEANNVRRSMIWIIIAPILASILIVIVGVVAAAVGFFQIIPVLEFLSYLVPGGIQILIFADCAMGYSRECGDFMRYSESVRYRSSWLAVFSIIFRLLIVGEGIVIFGLFLGMVPSGGGWNSDFTSRLTVGIAITGILFYVYVGIKTLFIDLFRE